MQPGGDQLHHELWRFPVDLVPYIEDGSVGLDIAILQAQQEDSVGSCAEFIGEKFALACCIATDSCVFLSLLFGGLAREGSTGRTKWSSR